ncbi:MAG: HDIG domain-containing protein, partial [Candidatus Methanomethyliaceae archaeon]
HVKEKWTRFMSLIDGVRKKHLRVLVNRLLTDREFVKKFVSYPAGIDRHHLFPGGLIDHTTSVIRLALHLSHLYLGEKSRYVDTDLLVVGAFLHDVGKILSFESTKLRKIPLGHVGQGIVLLDRVVRKIPSFPERDLYLLHHIIDSHHAHRGSHIQPLTIEAKLIHLADHIDASIDSYIDDLGIPVSPPPSISGS